VPLLNGYTARVAGTEKGLVGIEPEFSTWPTASTAGTSTPAGPKPAPSRMVKDVIIRKIRAGGLG